MQKREQTFHIFLHETGCGCGGEAKTAPKPDLTSLFSLIRVYVQPKMTLCIMTLNLMVCSVSDDKVKEEAELMLVCCYRASV